MALLAQQTYVIRRAPKDGADGKSIVLADVEYAISASNAIAPASGWGTAAPAWENGKYIWSRTKITYSDGTFTYTNAACITGATGSTGTGIESITEEYYLSASKTAQSGGAWSITPPAWESGKYIWTRSKITYKNPTSIAYTAPVCSSEWEAVNDIQEEIVRVETKHDTKFTLTDKEIALNASAITTVQNEVTGVKQRVTTAETAITQQAGQIALKASQTDVTALTSRVTSAEAKITSDAINLTVKSQTETIAGDASLVGKGQMLYRDPTFGSGNNGINTYNNLSNGTVVITRVSGITGNPNNSGYCLKITVTGIPQPGWGGFTFQTATKASQILVTRIIVKIPVGRTINWTSNATGDGRVSKWLTSQAGTGDWMEYVCKLTCGATGTFSSTNFFYLSGGDTPTALLPLEWYVAYATVFDATGVDDTPTRSEIQAGIGITASGLNIFGINNSLAGVFTFSSMAPDVQNAITTAQDTATSALESSVSRILYSKDRSAVINYGQYVDDPAATGGVAAWLYRGWNFITYFNAAWKNVKPGGKYRILARCRKVGALGSDGGIRLGIYSPVSAREYARFNILDKVTEEYSVVDIGAFDASWSEGDDLYLWWLNTDSFLPNDGTGGTGLYVDYIKIIDASSENYTNTALSTKQDAVVNGKTIIEGGYINTILIKAEEIVTSALLASKIAATDITTGRLTVTDGAKVAGLKVSGDSLTNEGFNNNAYIILRNDNAKTFVGIGANVWPSTGPYTATGRFENERSGSYQNIGLYVTAKNNTTANYGLYIAASGATSYDGSTQQYTGNHAIYATDGVYSGFRLRTRRVESSQTLSEMDNVILAVNTSAITLTFPISPKEGQIYFIHKAGGGNVTLSRGSSTHTVTWKNKASGGASQTSTAWEMVVAIWDKHNLVWFLATTATH